MLLPQPMQRMIWPGVEGDMLRGVLVGRESGWSQYYWSILITGADAMDGAGHVLRPCSRVTALWLVDERWRGRRSREKRSVRTLADR